ncbi:MAG: FMN-binding negative transcriptional regulator [Gammaproteobacteria bacterium]|jgi:transcriptional regulator|nr:FMN-binding negative transcriptional regulator [Gammaproteobacteria bacterium]MBU0829503.1 FMN-binding negative transcriptional regulator [Gammaproteobacteria bacterium]MBU0889946.1 FMN-binding negative transcriptional regulator [Gammaproteobacteria bacterium]MBU1817906.1 FMN-binding negative transcriptional regulator [Gammaproteobacteria bacterium]
MANPNRQFQVTDAATLQALVRAQPLATLVIAHEGTLHANHIPLYLDPDRGPHGTLIGHVARANGVWPLLPQQAVAVFHGPQAYVSPSWYPSKAIDGKQVPTWNYAAVHAHGTLCAVDDPVRLRAILHTLSERHEAHRANPWRIDDAPPDYIHQLLRAIVGIEMPVDRWEGIWKVSQNRSDTDRVGVVQGLLAEGTPAAHDMAVLVRGG